MSSPSANLNLKLFPPSHRPAARETADPKIACDKLMLAVLSLVQDSPNGGVAALIIQHGNNSPALPSGHQALHPVTEKLSAPRCRNCCCGPLVSDLRASGLASPDPHLSERFHLTDSPRTAYYARGGLRSPRAQARNHLRARRSSRYLRRRPSRLLL
jgi:hypothetical protein